MEKRILSAVFAFSLALTITACKSGKDAYREEPEPRRTAASNAATTQPSVPDYETIRFGGRVWNVLDVKNGKALIITNKVIAGKVMEESRAYNEEYTDVTWETCGLRAELNGKFYNSFDEADKARIVETRVISNDNPERGTPGGNDTTDKIFLLSIDEVNEYFSDDEARVVYNSEGSSSFWWLRSPGYSGDRAAYVSDLGRVNVLGHRVNTYYGVRPAMWIVL